MIVVHPAGKLSPKTRLPYAAVLAFMALSSNAASTTLQAGPAASTVYIVPPFIDEQALVMEAPVVGRTPIFPVIVVLAGAASVIPE